jgi:hypothetical protein
MRNHIAGLGAGIAVTFCGSAAMAQPFAAHGTVAVGVERVFGLSYSHQTEQAPGATTESKTSTTSISFLGSLPTTIGAIPRLSADVFLGPGVSLGGSMMVQHLGSGFTPAGTAATRNAGTTYFLFAPRVGFGIPFNDTLALWPRLGISYLYTKTSSENQQNDGTMRTNKGTLGNWYTTLDALLLISPVAHVAFTVGPSLDILISGPKQTRDGADVQTNDTSYYSLALTAGLTVWF